MRTSSAWFFARHPLKRLFIVFAALLAPLHAHAVASFGIQTGQPCAACHMGSYGPRLTAVGREFKLYGYSSSDNKEHLWPFNLSVRSSFTHTDAEQKGGAADGFDVNDNFAADALTITAAGRLANKIGMMARLNYNGVKQFWAWGGVDLRYADETTVSGHEVTYGVSANNTPSRTDIWDAFASGGSGSPLAKRAKPAPLTGSLQGVVAGASAYALWDDLLYTEFSAYRPLSRDLLNALGTAPLNGTDSFDGWLPYGRIAVHRSFEDGHHYLEAGFSALNARIRPNDDKVWGENTYTDYQFDATYQWVADPSRSVSDMFSTRLVYVSEDANLKGSSGKNGWAVDNDLDALRVEMAYSVASELTFTGLYFSTRTEKDVKRWKTPGGSADTSGWAVQADYVPFGKPDSISDWFNLRVTAQYTAYDQFNGTRVNASDNDALYLGISMVGTTNR